MLAYLLTFAHTRATHALAAPCNSYTRALPNPLSSTPDGAYYYYKTEDGQNYEDTIIALKAHADQEKIPIRWILYDSW